MIPFAGRRSPVRTLVAALALAGAIGAGASAVTAAADAAAADPAPVGLIPALLAPLSPPPAATPPEATAPASPGVDPCSVAPVTGDTTITMMSGGVARTAVLHLPPAARGKPLALIVAFHGFGGNGPRFEIDTGLSTLGDQQGYAAVYPTALGNQWAISRRERDVVFVGELIERVKALACIDSARVYATGVSIGAGMAARSGCELSDQIAALVLVSGGYKSLPPCNPDRPLSVLEIHGTADGAVPYSGVGTNHAGAVLPYISAWAARDRCRSRPAKTVIAAHTLRYRWSGCASGETVEHIRIYGSGHGLPNAAGTEISSGNRTNVSGVKNIWHFLASRTRGRLFSDE
ncbi:MAG: alpha/beta hydrolase family esterase [Solirubrobacteraceae bacterium]